MPLASIKTSDTFDKNDLLEVTVPMAKLLSPLGGICADIKVDRSVSLLLESPRFELLAKSISPMEQMLGKAKSISPCTGEGGTVVNSKPRTLGVLPTEVN